MNDAVPTTVDARCDALITRKEALDDAVSKAGAAKLAAAELVKQRTTEKAALQDELERTKRQLATTPSTAEEVAVAARRLQLRTSLVQAARLHTTAVLAAAAADRAYRAAVNAADASAAELVAQRALSTEVRLVHGRAKSAFERLDGLALGDSKAVLAKHRTELLAVLGAADCLDLLALRMRDVAEQRAGVDDAAGRAAEVLDGLDPGGRVWRFRADGVVRLADRLAREAEQARLVAGLPTLDLGTSKPSWPADRAAMATAATGSAAARAAEIDLLEARHDLRVSERKEREARTALENATGDTTTLQDDLDTAAADTTAKRTTVAGAAAALAATDRITIDAWHAAVPDWLQDVLVHHLEAEAAVAEVEGLDRPGLVASLDAAATAYATDLTDAASVVDERSTTAGAVSETSAVVAAVSATIDLRDSAARGEFDPTSDPWTA